MAAVMATALVACIFEKHFTLSHDLPGPDHWFSDDSGEAEEWVKAIKEAYALRGSGRVAPSETEKSNKKEFQRFMVASRTIRKGEEFSDENITFRRVQGGIGWSPSFFKNFVGKRANKDFSAMESIDL